MTRPGRILISISSITSTAGWYRILDATNQKYDDLKSPPSKTDYHPLGACYETLEALRLAG